MRLTIAGCGDAFGSGGRFNTCFHVGAGDHVFLIDCGASSLVALKRLGLDPNAITTVFVTHFHADHFGGVPFLVLDGQFSGRTAPLRLVGPAGLASWTERAMETAFPGSFAAKRKFEVVVSEIRPGASAAFDGVAVEAFQAVHGNPGGPFHAYRLDVDGKSLAYTGDTEWTEDLVPLGRDVDLLIAEAYTFERRFKLHLDFTTLAAARARIGAKRLILTHLGPDMLARAPGLGVEVAADGLVIEL